MQVRVVCGCRAHFVGSVRKNVKLARLQQVQVPAIQPPRTKARHAPRAVVHLVLVVARGHLPKVAPLVATFAVEKAHVSVLRVYSVSASRFPPVCLECTPCFEIVFHCLSKNSLEFPVTLWAQRPILVFAYHAARLRERDVYFVARGAVEPGLNPPPADRRLIHSSASFTIRVFSASSSAAR